MRPQVSCVFVCHDGDGRVLLARRSAGARDEPGTWDCGAGALEFGETFEAAVMREVREEYGVRPLDIERIGVRNVLRGDPVVSHWVALVFAVRVAPDAVAIGEPHKFDALEWFAPDALPSPLHSQCGESLALFAAAGVEQGPGRGRVGA
ncbi:NUDIX hydrolase [Streptomyces halobius]|uniref:NUDIX domain-containing protein n=1 Tax=Streptomyces halobius TaxID=2879846 RepID=A0ABY4MIV5_9ACTN|nr:NUDIX domain-containing protein [Streptomyces halobius]UQA96340.1 NUDIX domain-containing protein [Streptomyces halobius]